MIVRRLLIALAVLLVLTAVASGVSAPEQPAGEPEPEPRPSAETLPPEPQVLRADRSGQRVVARVGEWVHIEVRSDGVDTVDIADVGAEPVDPEVPARFLLRPETPGEHAIELLEAERRIGTLEIR